MNDAVDVSPLGALTSPGGTVAWSVLYRERINARRRLGDIWKVPVAKRTLDRVAAHLGAGTRVLEIGAGSREFGASLIRKRPDIVYRSMDVDRTQPHDYYDIGAIRERFDIAVMVEVIEHLELSEGIALFQRVKGLLVPGGRIMLTTPNVLHPTRYWGDCTHKTFYRYDELAGILSALGYGDVHVFRIHNEPLLPRLFRLYVGVYLHRYLDIDFARTIFVEARTG